jgi:hypothetical protein
MCICAVVDSTDKEKHKIKACLNDMNEFLNYYNKVQTEASKFQTRNSNIQVNLYAFTGFSVLTKILRKQNFVKSKFASFKINTHAKSIYSSQTYLSIG